jgi:hypothetical protein
MRSWGNDGLAVHPFKELCHDHDILSKAILEKDTFSLYSGMLVLTSGCTSFKHNFIYQKVYKKI